MTTTIAAISSPPGAARRGIIRLSGPETLEVVDAALLGSRPAGSPRGVYPGILEDGHGRQPVRVYWMPGPHSYTREDVAELHLPGAEVLLAQALRRLLELGAVAAEPGEFTRRAFHNGRLDLTRAEGVLELVNATNDAERRAATQLLSGGLERRIGRMRDELDELRALGEASLDFDETDTGHVPTQELLERLDALRTRLDEALDWEVARQAPSVLPRVLLHGAPNAGKSSLFNRLVPGARAIVDELAGTTRDGLFEVWRVGGQECLLIDTPGLDAAARGADETAQRLARNERASADLVLHVVDGARADPYEPADDPGPDVATIRVRSKLDLAPAGTAAPAGDALALSARTGEGLEELATAVAEALARAPAAAGGERARELFVRHRHCLEEAREAVFEARERLAAGVTLDLVAETLREASRSLDGIHGGTTPEDVLDRIFARFCLGK